MDKFLAQAPAGALGLKMILEKMQISSADQRGGLTRLEIFILSVVASNHHMSITHASSAVAHKPLHIQLKEFVSW
eukprot:9830961-Karenia_brevis.AAC.1